MGVAFQLGHSDHKVVEDFLLRQPAGVSAITLHAKAARHQQAAAEAAIAAGVSVFYNPATERLAAPGYAMPEAPFYAHAPYDVDLLASDAAARARLIDLVIEGHPTFTTAITPPHFYVNSMRSANLNAALAADTRKSTDKPIQAVLVLDRRFGLKVAAELAAQYAQEGIRNLELRLSPFGGEDESIAKIKSGFTILDAFRAAGITTTLGWSGNIGQSAVALGHTDNYSVGVGLLEHVSHTAMISRQRLPPKLDENGKKKGGPQFEGVYLPGIAATVSRKVAETLLGHTDLRLRLSCRLDECRASIDGPTRASRRHYLHARAHEMDDLLKKPEPWRATTEEDRLGRALALRDLVNEKYRAGDSPALKTRTLRSILDLSGESTAAQTA